VPDQRSLPLVRKDGVSPHPRVTASPLSLDEHRGAMRLEGWKCIWASWFDTAQERLLTMRRAGFEQEISPWMSHRRMLDRLGAGTNRPETNHDCQT
jgi:hypothetical protein